MPPYDRWTEEEERYAEIKLPSPTKRSEDTEANILVIGETCDDCWMQGSIKLNPEAPTLAFLGDGEQHNAGMAANVCNNLKTLNSKLNVCFITQEGIISKIRYVEKTSNQIVFRLDLNDSVKEPLTMSRLKSKLDDHNFKLADFDALVFSDYNKGFLSEEFIAVLSAIVDKIGIPIFLDTKKVLGDWSRAITYAKINDKEYKNNLRHLEAYTRPEYLVDTLIVTEGEDGATVYEKGEKQHFPANSGEVHDVCGAGDTFLSGLVVKYLECRDVKEAVRYANKCAAVAVSHKGVVAVQKDWVDE